MKKIEILHQAIAGTTESSDIQIMIDKNTDDSNVVELVSSVENQYGDTIRALILKTLDNMGVQGVKVSATDHGALDCTIIARTLAVVHRATDSQKEINWEEIEKWNV